MFLVFSRFFWWNISNLYLYFSCSLGSIFMCTESSFVILSKTNFWFFFFKKSLLRKIKPKSQLTKKHYGRSTCSQGGALCSRVFKMPLSKGSGVDIFVYYVVSAMITQLGHYSLDVAMDQKQMSVQDCFSLKLYLQKQMVGQISSISCFSTIWEKSQFKTLRFFIPISWVWWLEWKWPP